MEFVIPQIVIGAICGGICAAIAHSKGRNPVPWFFIGLLTNIIGVVLVLVVGNLNQERYLRVRQDDENRRLREQLRQERIKHDSLRQYTMKRLDVHDQVLGVDTRSVQALPSGNAQGYLPNGQAAAPPQAAPQPPRLDGWYFERNGETRGPVKAEVIQAMLADGQLTGHTLLWADHLPDWQPAAVIPEFGHRAT
jgi:hypothetical protein